MNTNIHLNRPKWRLAAKQYITLRTNIKKVRYTTNGVPHFFRQIGQNLTFIA